MEEQLAPNSTLGAEKVKQEMEEKEIIRTLFEEKDTYQSSNLPQRNEINSISKAYAGETEDTRDRSKSQEKIMKLRTETNYIIPSIFSGQPELEVEAVGEEDKDIAKVGEEIINYRLKTIPQAYERIESWVKQSVVFGTSLALVSWKFTTKPEGEYLVPVKDEPDIFVPNILDCFYNPIIPEVEGQNSIIIRSVVGLREVKENEAYGYNNGQNRLKVEPKAIQNDIYNSSSQVQADGYDLEKSSEGTVEVYDRITCERIQTVADGKEKIVLRDVPNPYGTFPVVKLVHEPNAIPNRFNGYGVGHNTLGLGKLIQKFSNRLTDNATMANTPAFLFKKGARINKKQLVIRPGGGIEVDSDGPIRDTISQVDIKDISQGGLALLNRFDDEHKRASGANDLIQGAASNKTLGQDQLASTYSSNRFELINRRFKQALADIGRILLMMEIEHIQSVDAPILKIFPIEAEVKNGVIRYSRETVYNMLIAARERDDLKFNIRIKGETNIARNKDMLLKQFAEWYSLFGAILPPQNQLAAAKKWLELRGIDEVDSLVPEPSEMEPAEMGAEMGAETGAVPAGMPPL